MSLQYSFGAASMWGVSTAISNPTPIRFGALQGVEIDFEFTTKPLYSSYQFPVAIGRGTANISGKAQFAQFNARIFNDLFFNESSEATLGETLVSINETHAIPGTTPFTITVTNAATFAEDLGVIYFSTGQPLTLVSGTPTTGQYAVNVSTGVYTFAAADEAMSVSISYAYTENTTGQTLTITNQLLGSAAFFTITISEVFQGNQLTLQLYQCMSDKISFPFSLEDFTISDFEFSAFGNSAGQIGTLSVAQ